MKFTCIKSTKEEAGQIFGRFILSNLIAGQGLTIGNALRRVLLANMEGTAITAIKIPGALHEFSTVEYIREDILEILLNLKQVILYTNNKNIISGKIQAKGPGIITASCLKFDTDVKILNPSQYIATISTDELIDFDIVVESGIGYLLLNQKNNEIVEFLSIDAVFMPIIKVNYLINQIPINQNEIIESLILEITTNGSITPENALQQSIQKLILWFSSLTNETLIKSKSIIENKNLKNEIILIEELELPVRAYNSLKKSGIRTLDELKHYSQEEIKEMKNLGKKSANDVFHALKKKFNITLPLLKI